MKEQEIISGNDQARLRRAGYVFVGPSKHSAVKVCLWTKHSILGEGFCYKQKFYGIQSHRCMQFTPAMPFCTHACAFCWRDTAITFPEWRGECDDPRALLDEAVLAQRKLLNGFPGNSKTNARKWREAQSPNQIAISLAGEPTAYPKLGELILEARARGMTSFLVTNGTLPEAIEKLAGENALPTQLYVSLCAFDEGNYKKVHNPLIKGGWKKLSASLELMPSLKTRRVIRLTMAKGLNMEHAEKYARLIEKAAPDYVEVKGYMAVGFSRKRLGPAFMPSHEEIRAFAREIAGETGFIYSDEQEASRVALLCRDEKAAESRLIK